MVTQKILTQDFLERYRKPVFESPVYDGNNQLINLYKAIVDDTGNVISIMSKRYSLIQNKDVIDTALESLSAITSNFQVETNLSYLYKNKMNLTLLLPDLFFPDDTKDGCSLALSVKNSYAGEKTVSVNWMMYRYWCLNGAKTIVPIKSINVKHTKALDIKSMTTIYEDAGMKIEKISERVQKLINRTDVVDTLKNELAERFPRLYNKIANEPYGNAYDFYNHCTKFITHTVAPRQRDIYYSFLNSVFMKEGYFA